MKKQFTHWFVLLALLLAVVLVACGPAEPPEGVAVDETEEATAVTEDDLGDASTEEETAVDPDAPETGGIDSIDAPVVATAFEYIELEEGAGLVPEYGDVLTIHYTFMLEDDTPFDSSYNQGEPVTFPFMPGQIPPGWEEGLKLMKEGGKAMLVIPPDMAFGAEGIPGLVPPNAVVKTEMELITVERPEPPQEVSDYETTETGLQYHDFTVGDGDTPEANDAVSLEFNVWLEDGMSLGGSQGEPMTFKLGTGQLFPGWEEGLLSMNVGGSRQLVVPPEIGLGQAGSGSSIPPNSTIIVEMTLLDIIKPPQQTEVDDADYMETESGLKYYDIEEGDGASPETGDLVSVHYTGWLEDGTIFDSSVERGTPFQFVLGTGSVIAGWDEGVADMQIGGKRQLVIPSDLAYGEQGSPPTIPPGATLIFEVELLDVTQP